VKIGRGNAAGVALGHFSTLSDVNTIITAMKIGQSTSGLHRNRTIHPTETQK
jgi:hypothetical protein